PAVGSATRRAVAARRAAQRPRRGGGRAAGRAGSGILHGRRQGADRLAPGLRPAAPQVARPRGLRAVKIVLALLRRDLALAFGGGRRGGAVLPVLFFLSVAMLFPFAVG